MPIQWIEPPPRAVELLSAILDGFVVDGKYSVRSLSGKSKDRVSIANPHSVYNVGLRELAEKREIESFALTAWRFLLIEERTPIAAAELSVSVGGEIRFSSLTTGLYVASTFEAISELSKNSEFHKLDWNVRLLRIPALYFMSLWLHGTSAKADRFRVLDPSPDFIEKGQIYSWNELAERLLPAARQRMSATPPSFQAQ